MRRSINLLPSERKSAIKLDGFNRFLFKIGFVSIFAIILFVVFLFANLFIISIYKKINEDEISRTESGELNSLIQEAKTEIDNYHARTNQSVKEINQRVHYWDYLSQLNELLPEKVYYSKIVMETEKIELKGLAKDRDDLVRFKELLSQSDFFAEVEMPISNFTTQEDVNFEISLTLEPI
jgi:Tfp pilus assembly protein PilN